MINSKLLSKVLHVHIVKEDWKILNLPECNPVLIYTPDAEKYIK